MFAKRSLLLGIFYLIGTNPIEAATYGITASTRGLNFQHFNILPYHRDRLSYSSFQLQGIRHASHRIPTSILANYGIGHRESLAAQKSIGIYGFIEGYLDGSIYTLQANTSSDLKQKNQYYDRLFSRLNIGLDTIQGSFRFAMNIYFPLYSPSLQIERQYLTTGGFEGGIFEKLTAAFPASTKEIKQKELASSIKNAFYWREDHAFQKYYYLEEGSHTIELQGSYTFNNHITATVGGYYFHDPYANHLLGIAAIINYAYRPGLKLQTKYSYDAMRNWHIILSVHINRDDRYLYHLPTYSKLWQAPDRHLSPPLLRNQTNRPVKLT